LPPSLNIAALCQRTGVPADTIRKWEQRYGVLRPERTPGGQRRYSEVDVARIEWLKARLAEGYRIGEAAELLGSGEQVAAGAGELRRAIVEATAANDVVGLSHLVEQAVALGSLEEAFVDVLSPALGEVGDRWAAGELSVAQEHLVSATVRGVLQRLLADARGEIRGIAVLACAPGERHEIGLLMLAVLLRSDGWQVAYLGADTPVDDAVALAEQLQASVLCFSASTREQAESLERALAERAPLTIEILVGGRGTAESDVRSAIGRLRKIAA
jgi:MerR family transcriptional regulator, light-induced transcriptional regulator